MDGMCPRGQEWSENLGRCVKNELDVNEVYDSFVEAMLWSSFDYDYPDDGVYLEDNYEISDVDENAERDIRRQIESFLQENAGIIRELGMSEEMVGHDLWLTSQGHGAGFWDRGYGRLGEELTESTHKFFGDEYPYAQSGEIYYNPEIGRRRR